MNNNLNILKNAGIDVEETLTRFCNNEALLIKLLKKFPDDKSFELAVEAIKLGEWEDAARHAHSLKGVSGNLGMPKLYKASLDLETILQKKETEKIESLLQDIKIKYDTIVNAINSIEV